MALYNLISDDDFSRIKRLPSPDQTQMWNALGRNNETQGNDNFFTKRAKSVENAIGTTLAAPASFIYDQMENAKTGQFLQDSKTRMQDIAKKYGYDSTDDFWDAKDKAEKEIYGKYGYDIDKYWNARSNVWTPATVNSADVRALDAERDNVISGMSQEDADRIRNFNTIENELRGQAASNAQEATDRAKAYEDYRKNNYVSQKINQDRGKFLGSAMNTLSTAVDLTGLGATPIANAVQGGIEGVADELEQNGLENFDWQRAGQNALTGAATGAVTGLVNKGISNSLAKNGGNLFRGGNVVTRGLNNLGSKTALGRAGSTLATGAARGAVSGAVGGATGAGLQSALNGVEFGQGVQNALQGAVQGAGSGAVTGATMAGVNSVINKTPLMQKINQANQDWQQSGDSFGERWKNTRAEDTWGNRAIDSAKSSLKNVGMSIKDVSRDGIAPERLINEMAQFDKDFNGGKGEINSYDRQDTYTMEDVANALVAGRRAIENGAFKDPSKAKEALNRIESISQKYDLGALEQERKLSLNELDKSILDDAVNNKGAGLSIKKVDDDTTAGITSDPRVRQQLVANIEAQLAENPNARIGDTNFDADAIISEYSDRLTPEQYRNFNPTDAENALVQELQNLESARGFSQPTPLEKPTMIENNAWDDLAKSKGFKDFNELQQKYYEANPRTNANAGDVLDWADQNPMAGKKQFTQAETSKEIKARNQIAKEIMGQFEAVGEPIKRQTKPVETFNNLYEKLGLSDENEIRQAVHYAEPGELIPTIIRESAGASGVIDFDDANTLVRDLGTKKSMSTKLVSALQDLIDSTDSTISGGKSGIDALELQRRIEHEVARAEGQGGDYHIGNTVVDSAVASNLKRISKAIGKNLDKASIDSGAVARTLAKYDTDLDAMRASNNNPKWQAYVDDIKNAQNISDLRGSISDMTKASIYINDGDNRSGTIGGRMLRNNSQVPLTKTQAMRAGIGAVSDKILGSKKAREIRLNNAEKTIAKERARVADANAQLGIMTQGAPTPTGDTTMGNNPSTAVYDTITQPISSTGGNGTQTPSATGGTAYNPSTQLYNAIGRTEGAINRDNERAAQYLTEVAQEAETVPNTLEGLVSPTTNTGSTSVYNSVYGTQAAPGFNSLEEEKQVYFFRPTGDEWTDMLSRAMRRAKNAEDYDSLGALFEMYQDAVAKNEKANSSSEVKLTDKQRQANAAQRALDDFETEESNFAYDVSDIPVLGQIANLGGNTYASKAEALALQVGYMLSGATVNAEEARKIGMAYVPQPRDNEATRRSKLAQLRGIISDYQQTYQS